MDQAASYNGTIPISTGTTHRKCCNWHLSQLGCVAFVGFQCCFFFYQTLAFVVFFGLHATQNCSRGRCLSSMILSFALFNLVSTIKQLCVSHIYKENVYNMLDK